MRWMAVLLVVLGCSGVLAAAAAPAPPREGARRAKFVDPAAASRHWVFLFIKWEPDGAGSFAVFADTNSVKPLGRGIYSSVFKGFFDDGAGLFDWTISCPTMTFWNKDAGTTYITPDSPPGVRLFAESVCGPRATD